MRLTASRLALARQCLWWARPEVDVPSLDVSRSATVGTELHALAEKEVPLESVSGDEEVDEAVIDGVFRSIATSTTDGVFPAQAPSRLRPAELKILARLISAWREWWDETVNSGFGVGGVTDGGLLFEGQDVEVPYAIDLATGSARRLPTEGQRDYSAASPTELCGTADLVLAYTVGDLEVIDYKTGRGPHRYVDHEEQMRFLGAAAALECGHEEVTVTVVHVTPDGCRTDSRHLNAFDIAVIVAQFKMLVGRIADSVARPGLHCADGYCKAMSVCPTTKVLLATAQMAMDQRRHLPMVRAPASNDEAYASLVAIDLLEGWIEARKADVKKFALRSPIVAPDGSVYASRASSRETPRLDVKGAVEKLDELGLKGAIETTSKVSWESIKDVFRHRQNLAKAKIKTGELDRTQKVVISTEEEKVRVALRSIGALKVSEFQKFEWRKPKTATTKDVDDQ